MYDLLDPADSFPGASAEAIKNVEQALGISLPADYRAFLEFSDGYNGEVSGRYLVLWSTTELPDLATGYDMLPPGPGQVLIGSNGGPTAFAIIDGAYVSQPFDAGPEDRRVLATDFVGFLAAIAGGEGF